MHLCQSCRIYEACYFTRMAVHTILRTAETITRQAPKGVSTDLTFLVTECPYFEADTEGKETPDE